MEVPPIEVEDYQQALLKYQLRANPILDPEWFVDQSLVNWEENLVLKYGLTTSMFDFMEDVPAGAIVQSDIVDHMLREDASDPCDRRGVLAF